MGTIVLVPGFWLGAWAWAEVTPRLRTAGHDVYPVTLTGLAERAAEADPRVNVDTHIADLVGLVRTASLRDVILVGHSGANMAVTGAADRLGARVARVVYVDTGPMPSGMASIDFHGPQAQRSLRDQVARCGDGWLLPVPVFDPAADPVNLAGLADEQLAVLRSRGTPQPFGTVTQPLERPDPRPAVPASVIATTLTPEQGRALAESGNPVFAEMAGIEMHHLPTGHWPMFSRPAELAGLLATLAGPDHAQ
jgi:pimeloyl-ACP methyl ester carboxylesterase